MKRADAKASALQRHEGGGSLIVSHEHPSAAEHEGTEFEPNRNIGSCESKILASTRAAALRQFGRARRITFEE